MKINIETNERGVIVSWTSYPLDEGKPMLDIDDPSAIKPGFDKFVGGVLIRDEEGYEKHKLKVKKAARIAELKRLLSETDYKVIKYFEGELGEGEFKAAKELRSAYRKEINELEEEIKA